MATKRSKINGTIPAGFSEVDNSLRGFWKPEAEGQTLQGTVVDRRETTGADNKTNVFYAVRITDAAHTHGVLAGQENKPIEIENGDLVGVGGAILVSFLRDREGQEVFLVYDGIGEKKRGKNAPKLYKTYAKDYDRETGEVRS